MQEADIKREYERLGYQLGWTFMMTPEATLQRATTCLVGLNPGGREPEKGIWSCEGGNAYYREKWRGEEFSPLQKQVQAMDRVLGRSENDYLAAQFVPFRSADWESLGNGREAVEFGGKLWEWVLSVSPASLFICLGTEASDGVKSLLDAGPEATFGTGWGNTTIGRSEGVGRDGRRRVVVRLPHLSRYTIFERSADRDDLASSAFRQACR